MSTTDEARLDALDRRGRAAARTLRDDLASRGTHTLVAEDAPATATGPGAADSSGPSDPPESTELAPVPATEPPALPEPTTIRLDRRAVRGVGLSARHRLLAAAIVAVLVAAGAVTVATRDSGRPDASSGGPLDYLLPGWLPAGLEPVHAINVPDTAAMGFGGDIAVYGDPDTDDPLVGPPRGDASRRRRGAAGWPAVRRRGGHRGRP
jgi:hypothetical protein